MPKKKTPAAKAPVQVEVPEVEAPEEAKKEEFVPYKANVGGLKGVKIVGENHLGELISEDGCTYTPPKED